jgi:hypothetical protein
VALSAPPSSLIKIGLIPLIIKGFLRFDATGHSPAKPGELLNGIQEVRGSNPLGSTILYNSRTTVAGPFSPAGTGNVVLYGGVLTNKTRNGTYAELNLRNQFTESTTLGNDIEIAGSGLAVVDLLGTALSGATVTLGNLKIGVDPATTNVLYRLMYPSP